MNIVKNQPDALNYQLTIEIAAADYAEPLRKRLNEYKRKADIKGFRKGMAPLQLIQRMYGDQALYESVNGLVGDSIEAASRTMKEFTPEACDRFVENIVAGKEKLGQFEDADITLHDLNLMKNMLKTYLLQIFHGRVSYPKRKR